MAEYKNPAPPRKGESQKDFIGRCIAFMRKEGKYPKKQQTTICYSMWKRRNKNSEDDNMKEYNCDGTLEVINVPKELENGENISNNETEKVYRITAMIGDRFMNGGFFPAKELKRIYKQWEGTKHDVNHFGTTYPTVFGATSNIFYFIGYHKNVKYNSTTKEVTMDIEINPNAMYAKAWEAYIDICKMSDTIPNVSVTYMGKQEYVLAKNLPKEANWKAEGFGKDDLVPVLMEVEPVCVSTVLRGRCNDEDGCGIRNSYSQDEQEITDALDKERQEIIKYLKEKEEN